MAAYESGMDWRAPAMAAALGMLLSCSRSDTPAIRQHQHTDDRDSRRGLPLLAAMADHQKRSMREHLEAIAGIVTAIAAEDFSAVEREALRLGSSKQMEQMCTHMGSGAPEFAEQAIAFHRTADRVAESAAAHDPKVTLKELGSTLQACTSCHAQWKQRIVDEAEWARDGVPAR